MAGFQDIIGQEQICEHLQTALKLQKVSHAYIINGERNSGKNLSRGFSPWRCSVPERGKALSGLPFVQTGTFGKPSGYYPDYA